MSQICKIICLGDIVKVSLPHYSSGAEITGKVIHVKKRLGCSDLITVEPIVDTRPPVSSSLISKEVVNSFDVGFVVEIISRVKQTGREVKKPLENIYNHPSLDYMTKYYPTKHGKKVGPFYDLLQLAMRNATIEVLDLDFGKAFSLWQKQRVGFIRKVTSYYDSVIEVSWKPFKKWVRRNQSKLIKSRSILTKEIKEQDRKLYEELVDDFWEDECSIDQRRETSLFY